MLPKNCLNECFRLVFETEQKVSFSLKAQWFIRTKIIKKRWRWYSTGHGSCGSFVCLHDPFLWSYLNHEAVNNNNWHSVTKHYGKAYLVKMLIPTLVQSPAEGCVKCISSTNAFHMDQSSMETVLTVLDTHVIPWKIHFLFLIAACVHEWT